MNYLKSKAKVDFDKIELFVFDFDGVMTDNYFYLDQNGNESVKLSRSDGLAINALHKLKKKMLILSSEKNKVVLKRAKKLLIKSIYGIDNKKKILENYCKKENISSNNVLYVGNDINDYFVMKFCGFSACPLNSHKKIKDIATFNLRSLGGHGVIRELIEGLFKIDLIKIFKE